MPNPYIHSSTLYRLRSVSHAATSFIGPLYISAKVSWVMAGERPSECPKAA